MMSAAPRTWSDAWTICSDILDCCLRVLRCSAVNGVISPICACSARNCATTCSGVSAGVGVGTSWGFELIVDMMNLLSRDCQGRREREHLCTSACGHRLEGRGSSRRDPPVDDSPKCAHFRSRPQEEYNSTPALTSTRHYPALRLVSLPRSESLAMPFTDVNRSTA